MELILLQVKLVEIINDFFGSDASYYGINPYDMTQHLIDNNITIKED